MPTCPLLADRWAAVKADLLDELSDALDALAETAFSADFAGQRVLESGVWSRLLQTGRVLLGQLLSLACLAQTARHPAFLHERTPLRVDASYRTSLQSTLGPIVVFLCAFRDPAGKTLTPARGVVMPRRASVRATELLVEWSSRIGAELPFRAGQQALSFFTHDAVHIEDTTLQRQAQLAGRLVSRQDCFRSKEDIEKLLRNRATRDSSTGRPLVYLSSDAHALRRYVDDSCHAPWKMINGIRMWCVDRRSGATLHLGGEYTWGEAEALEGVFKGLQSDGFVPADSRFGDVEAQFVLVLDGADWLRDRWKPHLPEDTVYILDFFHVQQNVAAVVAAVYGQGSKLARSRLARVFRILAGRRRPPKASRSARKGQSKKRRRRRRRRAIRLSAHQGGAGMELVDWLADTLKADADAAGELDALDKLLAYLERNADRLDFPSYQRRNYQIGSGAMESFHRQASQLRLKRPGARWLPENALGILRLRLMTLAGRWEHFWAAPGRALGLHERKTHCTPRKEDMTAQPQL